MLPVIIFTSAIKSKA